MIPPVSQCASAFSVNSDRSTAADHSRRRLKFAAPTRAQNDSTSARDLRAWQGSGAARKEGTQLKAKPELLARAHVELANRAHVLAAQWHRGVQQQSVRTGDELKPPVTLARHPGDDRSVFEADDELGTHGNRAA